jgi:hypothetical protein
VLAGFWLVLIVTLAIALLQKFRRKKPRGKSCAATSKSGFLGI